MKSIFLAVGAGLGVVLNAGAIPTLQLDASPATYDPVSETTVSDVNNFTLYALLNGLTPSTTDKYYIIAGLQPKNSPSANLGSFVFNGTTVQVTSGMQSGKPFGWNNTHGIYPTYFATFQFNWNPLNRFNNYDVSLVSGTHNGPTPSATGNSLYMGFNVDLSGLVAGTELWYDLVEVNSSGTVVNFEPFSHADQAGSNGSVPDGGVTVLLLGMGLSGLGLLRWRMN